jgi:hypothetical protein
VNKRFNPGDTVRYTGAEFETGYALAIRGKVGTVVEHTDSANVSAEFDGVGYGLLPGNLELVFPAEHAVDHEVLSVDIPVEPTLGSVVLDSNGTAWQRQNENTDRWLKCACFASFATALPWAHLVAESRKLTVIYRAPEAA